MRPGQAYRCRYKETGVEPFARDAGDCPGLLTNVPPPWEFTLSIPDDRGRAPSPSRPLARTPAGTFYDAELTLNVVPSIALKTLSVSPANVVLTDAELPQSLVVLGNYADGTLRDLSGARAGTTFLSQDFGGRQRGREWPGNGRGQWDHHNHGDQRPGDRHGGGGRADGD